MNVNDENKPALEGVVAEENEFNRLLAEIEQEQPPQEPPPSGQQNDPLPNPQEPPVPDVDDLLEDGPRIDEDTVTTPRRQTPPRIETPPTLTQSKIVIRTTYGYDRVQDTQANRDLLKTQLNKKRTVNLPEEDERFIVKAPPAEPAPAGKQKAKNDDSHKLIADITLGVAVVDIRRLRNSWDDDDSGMGQRAIKPAHVGNLKADFATGIKRVLPENRMYVSMTSKDLDMCIAATAKANELDDESHVHLDKQIRHGESLSHFIYEDFADVPRLLIPYHPGTKSRVDAQVEAGQHRTEAMLRYAADNGGEDDVSAKDELVGNFDPSQDEVVANWYGWTVVILDKEKMLDTQNRRALALVRANPDAVYAQDSAGTMFISGIIHLEKLNDNEREKALGDLETYLRKFLRLPEADLTRFKRLIKIPTIRSALTILTKTLWGRDHFSGYRAEQLTAPRVAPLIKMAFIQIKTSLNQNFNPRFFAEMRQGERNPDIDMATKMSLNDIEAINECFPGGKFNKAKWLALFFPSSVDNVKFKTLPEPDWPDVHSARYKMPGNTSELRENREYRRPLFLHFLNSRVYMALYLHFLYNADNLEVVAFPRMYKLKEETSTRFNIFLPTAAWFKSFCDADLPKFAAMQRLHWALCCPDNYAQIIPMSSKGSGQKKTLDVDFDQLHAMRNQFLAHKQRYATRQLDNGRVEIPADAELLAQRNVDIRSLDPDEASEQALLEREHWRNQYLANNERLMEAQFQQYYLVLFAFMLLNKQSFAEVEKLCDVDTELFISPLAQPQVVVDFLQRLLTFPQMKRIWEKTAVSSLGRGFARGWGQVLNADDLDPATNDKDVDEEEKTKFWDLLPDKQIQSLPLAQKFVNDIPYLEHETKQWKLEKAKRLQPLLDAVANSLVLESSAKLLAAHVKFQESEHIKNLPADSPARYGPDAPFSTRALADDRLNIADNCLSRLSNDWKYVNLAMSTKDYLALNPKEQKKRLPHQGTAGVNKLLALDEDGLPRFEGGTFISARENAGAGMLLHAVGELTPDHLGYNLNEAIAWSKDKEAQYKKGVEKGKKRKAALAQLAEMRGAPNNQPGALPGSGADKRKPAKPPQRAPRTKPTQEKNDRFNPAPPSGRKRKDPPEAESEDESEDGEEDGEEDEQSTGGTRGAEEDEDDEVDDDDLSDDGAAITVPNTLRFDVDVETHVLTHTPTIRWLYDNLQIGLDNDSNWQASSSLANRAAKATFTKKAKADRLKQIKDFAIQHNLGWTPATVAELPWQLAYESAEKYKAAQAKASKPAGPRKNGKNTGTKQPTPQKPKKPAQKKARTT